MITPQQISSTYPITRPHIRNTPIIDLDGGTQSFLLAHLLDHGQQNFRVMVIGADVVEPRFDEQNGADHPDRQYCGDD